MGGLAEYARYGHLLLAGMAEGVVRLVHMVAVCFGQGYPCCDSIFWPIHPRFGLHFGWATNNRS